jgi:hypothetical protein
LGSVLIAAALKVVTRVLADAAVVRTQQVVAK